MSTRKGTLVLLEDVLDRSHRIGQRDYSRKESTLENKDEVARQVGIGAVILVI